MKASEGDERRRAKKARDGAGLELSKGAQEKALKALEKALTSGASATQPIIVSISSLVANLPYLNGGRARGQGGEAWGKGGGSREVAEVGATTKARARASSLERQE